MNIAGARKRCDELQKQIIAIQDEYAGSNGYAKYVEEQKIKPLYDEWNKLSMLIKKAEEEIEIEIQSTPV